jgi:hypothetical protein
MTYLYQFQNPNAPIRSNGLRFFGYPQRTKPIRYIVMHTPEVLFDIDPPDRSAEAVANYFATTDRSASAHVMIDSDSTVVLLPPEAVAFHVVGYNTEGYGIECGWSYLDWGKYPDYDAKIIEGVARHIVADPVLAAIPTTRLSKSSVDAGLSGYVSHATLDPTRRKDPGAMFPWERLFARVNELKGNGTMWTKPGDPINNLADANSALYSQGSIAGATAGEASYNPDTLDEANDRIWITLARNVDMLMQHDIRMTQTRDLLDTVRDEVRVINEDLVLLDQDIAALQNVVAEDAAYGKVSWDEFSTHRHETVIAPLVSTPPKEI